MRIKRYKRPKKIYSIQQCLNDSLSPLGFNIPPIDNRKYVGIRLYIKNKKIEYRVYVFTNSLMNVCLGYLSLSLKEAFKMNDKKYCKFIKEKLQKI